MPHQLRSDKIPVWHLKYIVPSLSVCFAFALFGDNFPTPRFLPVMLLLLFAAFLASLAEVRADGGRIRYRRFFKWHDLPPEEILGARAILPPFIGSIRLKNSISPWGNLYFCLDRNTTPNPFRSPEFPLLRYLNEHSLGATQSPPSRAPAPYAISKLLLAALAGILACFLILYLTPGNPLPKSPPVPVENSSPLLNLQFQLVAWMSALPIQAAGLFVMAFLAFTRRNKSQAWLFAFLAGFAFVGILSRFLN